jgi:spermidine synthase
MVQGQSWFIEKFESEGTCFGLRLQEKLHEERSEFQHIEIYQTDTFGRLMVLDGCIMVTDRDHFFYHEVMAHGALLRHPDPKKVAIIGGGDCGTLAETLKHANVDSAVQVELDERVTRLSEIYFPDLCSRNADPRAVFCFEDGNAWVKRVEAGALDVIIVDSTDPVGPAAVLFSEEFLAACWRALGPDGILIQQSESPLLHAESIIRPLHQTLQGVGFSQTQTLQFPQPGYPSGWWSATMGLKGAQRAAPTPEVFKQLKTQYLNAETYAATMALPAFMTCAAE